MWAENFVGCSSTHASYATDFVLNESQAMHFPIEFLEVSWFPSHVLSLKLFAPIIILRSLDPPKVTNGTRCVITKLSANTIEARISHGI